MQRDFFEQIDASVPRGLAVRVVLDNLSTRSAPEITRWLAHKDRRRWHLHFTPTSSSWLNLIEAITAWAKHWNTDPGPFIWKATAENIIAKVQRGRQTLHQTKSINDGALGHVIVGTVDLTVFPARRAD